MTELKPHASHWGAFTAMVEDGQFTAVRPFAHDSNPPALLASLPSAIHAPSRSYPAAGPFS